MTANYIFIFFGLMVALVGLYAIYDRFLKSPERSASNIYVEALRHLLDGKTESAFSKLRQVVAEDSSNIDAYIRLGEILRENNKPQQALQVHKDLTLRSDLDPEQKAVILSKLADDYIALGNSDTAEAALRELISLDHRDRSALVRLLNLQKKADDWEAAYDTAVTLLKQESDKSKKPLAVFKYQMGRQLYLKREYHKARIVLKEAMGLDPKCVPAYLMMGDSYRDENRLEDAVTFWEKLISAAPEEGHRAIERLQKALFELGRFGDIADICENILSHSPDNLEVGFTLAEFYEKKGEVERAEEILVRLVENNPRDLKSLIGLIRILLGRGDNRKIEHLLRSQESRWDKIQHVDSGSSAFSNVQS